MLPIAIILTVIAAILLWFAQRQSKTAGLPYGKIIYNDTRAWNRVEKTLFHPTFRLAGKPDYVVKQGNTLIPVEIKSTRIKDAPLDGHIYQLAAYCLLIQNEYGIRPSYGILGYSNRSYKIDYTEKMELSLTELLEEMRSKLIKKNIPRSHNEEKRCIRCGYNSICDQRLAG
jgi:CRISPR-associated exonuclease Cas4